jgi:hypothetical protein
MNKVFPQLSFFAILFLFFTSSQNAYSDMDADATIQFPEKGALPAKYPPDVPVENYEVEEEYYLFQSPNRSLKQIETIQKEMPKGNFSPPKNDWRFLSRTHTILTKGGELNLLAIGDSIVNDTMRSAWIEKLRQQYPKATINATVYVRGGGGCQHYKVNNRIDTYAIPRKPNLVLIGGISQHDIASIREVIHQLRKGLPDLEILLFTGTFGRVDPRDKKALSEAKHSGSGTYGKELSNLAKEEHCAYLDMTTPWAEYICSANVHPYEFYRDHVHANEFGEQILSKIMMAFWD